MFFVKGQPSPLAIFGGDKGSFCNRSRLRIDLPSIKAFEFLCLLDRQPNQNPPPSCIYEIPSGSRVA